MCQIVQFLFQLVCVCATNYIKIVSSPPVNTDLQPPSNITHGPTTTTTVQWVSPGPQCRVLQDTMRAIRDRTLELPQWWLHSIRGLWEGPALLSHWVVLNQEQPTGSECGLQMGHQSAARQGRWMWQLWKVVRGVLTYIWVYVCTRNSIWA